VRGRFASVGESLFLSCGVEIVGLRKIVAKQFEKRTDVLKWFPLIFRLQGDV